MAPAHFWAEFPVNLVCPGKPSLKIKKLKQWVRALGVSDEDRFNRVVNYIQEGAEIGCRGAARLPSKSTNAASAYEFGPQVTDAVAEWVKKGYAFGPVCAGAVPDSAKISGIMVRPKPNGSVRVILNLSAPKGRSVNDGINKEEFPAKMSSTGAWLRVLDNTGRGCLMTKTDWAAAYKHICVRLEDTDLQWAGKYFKELCLIFGSASSAGIFDDVAKLVLDLVCRRASFPRNMVCQHLDDVCAAAAAGSTALHRLDTAFQEIAGDLGVELAPRDDPEKSFAPSTQGVIFGVFYDTVNWTWSIPADKLARTCNLLADTIEADKVPAKEFRSLAGKLIHVKPLVPAGRFNIDKIMKTYAAAAKTEGEVQISSACEGLFGTSRHPQTSGSGHRGGAGRLHRRRRRLLGSNWKRNGRCAWELVVLYSMGQAHQCRRLEGGREESRAETVGVRTGGSAHSSCRRPRAVPGPGTERVGRQHWSSGGIP
jgi:hypothetical protein